jgi:hypothetical protein
MIQETPLFGLSFRPNLYNPLIEAGLKDLNFLEIMTENYLHHGKAKKSFLDQLAATWNLSLHGVGLSIGGTDSFNTSYLDSARLLIKRLRPRFVTDHLCWTSFKGHNSHDLLPLPYNNETLRHVISRVQYVQEYLGERLYLENPSAYTLFLANTMEEADFFAALTKESGCGILLDVNNLFVVHHNLGIEPHHYLRKLDPSSICYLHMAGYTDQGTILVDTHDQPVSNSVLNLYDYVVQLFPHLSTIIEWDGDVPSYQDLITHLKGLKKRHKCSTSTPKTKDIGENIPFLRSTSFLGSTPVPLEAIQKQFFSLITSHQQEQITSDAIQPLLDHVTPAPALLGLKIYRDAYWVRLIKAIRNTYPCLLSLLGSKEFSELVSDYLVQFPPSAPDIKFVGQYLPKYLRAGKTAKSIDVQHQLLADIAALEWAKYDALDDCDDFTEIPSITLSQVTAEAWPHLTVGFNPDIRIIETEWEVGSVLEQHANGEIPEKPKRNKSRYLVKKREHDVEVSNPASLEFQLFKKLRDGIPFERALLLCYGRQLTEEDVCQGVTWLSNWCSSGFVTSLFHSELKA